MYHRVLGNGIIRGQSRTPSVPVELVRGLRVHDENHVGLMVPIRSPFAVGKKLGQRRTLRRFGDATVYFIAKAIGKRQARRRFPRVLKVEVVGLATDSRRVELAANGSEFGRKADVVRSKVWQ